MRDESFEESRNEERKRVKGRESRDNRENKGVREVLRLERRIKVGKRGREKIRANIRQHPHADS